MVQTAPLPFIISKGDSLGSYSEQIRDQRQNTNQISKRRKNYKYVLKANQDQPGRKIGPPVVEL